ncbi:PAS domain-containing protein [Melioribacteraceae bacterium 4301-Me]|uniref:PAS domain-containing protein n=1 Tax=Pyranulibacter aquaticus TaxID=3163344 RepID=UPI00359929CF
MTDKAQIDNYFKSGDSKAIFVVDKTGKIIALNSFAKKLLGGDVQGNFFQLFEPKNQQVIEQSFNQSVQSDIFTKQILDITYEYETHTYEINFIPLKSESNIYVLVELSESEFKVDEEKTKKFWISTTELEKSIIDKKLLEIIERIKSSFPFSFIEKTKLQKDINQLNNFFWIKDPAGKIIIANQSFAEAFATKPSQMEGSFEIEFLPKHLLKLFKTIDNYIIETSNVVLIEGLSSQLIFGMSKGLQLVFFPILDIDRKTVAIVGLSQISSASELQLKIDEFTALAIKSFDFPMLIVDNQNKITAFTYAVNELLGLGKEIDLSNYTIDAVLDKELLNTFNKYKDDVKQKNSIEFSYVIVGTEKLKVRIKMKKIFDTNDNLIGIQLEFIPQHKEKELTESKAKMYDALFQALPEAMFIYDVDNLKFLEVNNAALSLYGYSREEFLNMDLTDLYAPEDIQTLLEAGERKTKIGDYSGPWKHKRRDGTTILVKLNRSNIVFHGKNAHLNIIKDISEEFDPFKKIQIFQPLLENSSDILLTTDKDGIILFTNETFTRKLGYPKREIEKKSFLSLVSDNDRSKVSKEIFRSSINSPLTLNVDLKKSNGEFIKANLVSIPIVGADEKIELFNIILKLEEEIKKEQKQAYVDLQSKIDPPFLSNVFHEILTPINVIIGFVQELAESIKEPNEEQKEAIEIIQENQKLLLQIMDNAVDYSALEQQSVKLKLENITFTDLLEELRNNTKKMFDSRQVELNYGKISTSLTFESDKQKVLSLITLFLKFASQITKEKVIYLSAYYISEEKFAVAIRDSKSNISQYLLKAFDEIFSQHENTIRRNYGFSRFSVKLANKLIEVFSVEKEVITKEGQPYEYALIFPVKFIRKEDRKLEVKRAEKPTEVFKEDKIKPKEIIEKPVPKVERVEPIHETEKRQLELSQLSCLYMEDQLDSQILFKVQMKDLKTIEFADSLENALPLLKTKKFDFIIIDINLKGEYNGLDALRIIHKMPGYADVPIIASTAYLLPGDKESFISAGFRDFIPKPLLRDKILDVLQKIFNLRV